jgi:hypothetical protein
MIKNFDQQRKINISFVGSIYLLKNETVERPTQKDITKYKVNRVIIIIERKKSWYHSPEGLAQQKARQA